MVHLLKRMGPAIGRGHDVLRPLLDPGVRPPHREIRPGFVDEDEAAGIDGAAPPPVGGACLLDVGAIDLTRAGPFLVTTYPARRTARHRLDGVVWCAAATRRLYSTHSSAQVASGASAISACSVGIRIGDRQPPPLGFGVRAPSARYSCTHRCGVRTPIANTSPGPHTPLRPPSYACTARRRRRHPTGSASREQSTSQPLTQVLTGVRLSHRTLVSDGQIA